MARQTRYIDVAVIVLLFPLILGTLFTPLLGGGRILALPDSDAACEWWWKRQYVGAVLRSGHLPQWNPFAMSGAPLLATSQPAPFYPPNWLWTIVSPAAAFNANVLFHFWLALAGMYLLVRYLHRSPEAAILGAVIFGLGGTSVQHWRSGHLQFGAEIAMMPFALIALLALHRANSWRMSLTAALALTFVMTVQVLAGHPQIVYYTAGILLMIHITWILWCVAVARGPGAKMALTASAWTLVAVLLAGTMTAAQVLPLLEFAKLTVRTQSEPLTYFTMHSQHISNLFTFVAPWTWGGNPLKQTRYLDTNGYWETTTFIVGTAAVLCIGAFARAHRTAPMVWVCLLGAVICELLATGRYGPLFERAFHLVPGFNLFRCPGRLLIPFTFFAALLAGIGLDELHRLAGRSKRGLIVLLITLVAVIAAAALSFHLAIAGGPAGNNWFARMLVERQPFMKAQLSQAKIIDPIFRDFRHGVFGALAIGGGTIALGAFYLSRYTRRFAGIAIAAVGCADILYYAYTCRAATDPATFTWPAEITEHLQKAGPLYRIASARNNLDLCQGMVRGIRQVWGYETGIVARYNEAIAASQKMPLSVSFMNQRLSTLSPLLNSLGVKYLISSREFPKRDPAWKPIVKLPKIELYENPNALPRMLTVSEAWRVSPQDSVRIVNEPGFDARSTVLIDDATTATDKTVRFTTPTAPMLQPAGDIHVIQDAPELLSADIEMQRAGWFVVMDQLLPGWSAKVDEATVTIERANAVGRAIQLSSGLHRVEMTYSAPGLTRGLIVSLCGWVLWSVASATIAVQLLARQRSTVIA